MHGKAKHNQGYATLDPFEASISGSMALAATFPKMHNQGYATLDPLKLAPDLVDRRARTRA